MSLLYHYEEFESLKPIYPPKKILQSFQLFTDSRRLSADSFITPSFVKSQYFLKYTSYLNENWQECVNDIIM